MDWTLDPEIDTLRLRIRQFVHERLLPLEGELSSFDEHENIRPDLLETLRTEARSNGLWCLQMPRERGGLGLPVHGMAACYEEMNHSIFGPVVFNSAAPDDGNMLVLEKVCTPAQKKRWLQPIVNGRVRSAFAMTEPMPGAGSDPSMMQTRAERHGDRWVINGRKWFITGASAAEHFIVVARTSDDARRGLTAFLFHRDDPGWHLGRRIPIMGPEEHGGHCEMFFDGLEIPDEQRLMAVGDGLRVTQIRLGIARLTHCMRWLGLSKRALAIAVAHARERTSGGAPLIERESIRLQLGEAALRIECGRLLTMKAALEFDRGGKARKEVSMAKVVVSETLHQAVDTAIQVLGAKGYSKDTPLEWIYRYARQARLVDGASEVHRGVLARHVADEGIDFWGWTPPGSSA